MADGVVTAWALSTVSPRCAAGPSSSDGWHAGTASAAGTAPGYPERGWPLWFVEYAFIHTRRAGGLFTLGLVLNALLPVELPLPWL